MPINVVFVCLGNICRSPMAEGIFAHLVQDEGLGDQITVDSCGTGSWHVGESPHRGTQKVLKKHGIKYSHRARQLNRSDFQDADYLIAMDSSNLTNITRYGNTEAEVDLLLDYADTVTEHDVPDPYYTGGFDVVYELVEAGCRGLLAHIRHKDSI